MKTLKVAVLYYLLFFVSLYLLKFVSTFFEIIDYPYEGVVDILFASIYFTVLFTLFDHIFFKHFLKNKDV
ncbi:hypothetical protein CIK86_12510 [Pseudoalteromonas sp. JB197]|nr:hypothetical protein CIK86_12510 [Pseudoalteromonas sp. JB197]